MKPAKRRWSGVAVAVVLGWMASTPLAAETLRYVALVDGGKQAGHQTVTWSEGGETTVEFIFKDNGRGPELSERYTLAEDGTFLTYEVKGESTFGAPVAESFSREGNAAGVRRGDFRLGRTRGRAAAADPRRHVDHAQARRCAGGRGRPRP